MIGKDFLLWRIDPPAGQSRPGKKDAVIKEQSRRCYTRKEWEDMEPASR